MALTKSMPPMNIFETLPARAPKKYLARLFVLFIYMIFGSSPVMASTAIGDGGHYLRYGPKVYFFNPDGRAFRIVIHLMRWPVAAFNPTNVSLRLTAPNGKYFVNGSVKFIDNTKMIVIPVSRKGVWLLEMNLRTPPVYNGPDFWVESSLNRSVVFTGNPHATEVAGNAIAGRWLVLLCAVPRRWWFWVPPGTKSFIARTQRIQNCQSQREDWGITIYSPRGQRVRQLWGDLDMERGRPFVSPQSRNASVVVNVEPGNSGRFWSVEMRQADSHNYSKISLSLEGIPPYVARSPEDWFDPTALSPVPDVPLYDNEAFIQSALSVTTKKAWPWLEHFLPTPSLGDPDGSQIRGNASFAIWNPQKRLLKLRVGTYLPRDTGEGKPLRALVKINNNAGNLTYERQIPILHIHGDGGQPSETPEIGKGVSRVTVRGTERWFAFTYPATPLGLIGSKTEDGWFRFPLEVGTARHWYFYVPRHTKSFAIRSAAYHNGDRLLLEVNAPDRTLAILYGREAEQRVVVPPGLDGKIWHLRVDVGSGSVMQTDGGADSRYLGIYSMIDLKGVPEFLSPTWEQWFNPRNPQSPSKRDPFAHQAHE